MQNMQSGCWGTAAAFIRYQNIPNSQQRQQQSPEGHSQRLYADLYLSTLNSLGKLKNKNNI